MSHQKDISWKKDVVNESISLQKVANLSTKLKELIREQLESSKIVWERISERPISWGINWEKDQFWRLIKMKRRYS